VLLLVLLTPGCGRPPTAEAINVGQLVPLSGGDKAIGDRAERGARLAVEEIDKDDKGIAGRRVAVIHADTHGEAEAAGAVAVRLVRVDRVAGVLGGHDAPSVAAITRTLQPYAQPFVATAPLPAPLLGDNAFSVGIAPAIAGQAMGRFVAQNLQKLRIAVVADTRPTSSDFKEGFAREIARANLTRPDEWTFANDAEIGPIVDRVKKAQPTAVLIVAHAREFGRLRLELSQGGVKGPFLFGGEETAITQLLADNEAGNEVYVATAFLTAGVSARGEAFIKVYQDRFHELPDAHAALANDCAIALFEAMRQANTLEGAKIRDALAGRGENAEPFTFESLTGPATFAKDRYARRPVFIAQVTHGQLKLAQRWDPPVPDQK
jgi:branched-chain amino acid transport system substrate-binding protein